MDPLTEYGVVSTEQWGNGISTWGYCNTVTLLCYGYMYWLQCC